MLTLRIVSVVVGVAVCAVGASVEQRLAEMLRHNPKADTDGDGKLAEQEAMKFVFTAARGRKNRGPAIGYEEWFAVYEERSFEGMGYRIMPPLEVEPGKLYPLVVSLHGAGGIGDDNLSQLRPWNGLMAEDEWRLKYPSFVIVPQTTPGSIWGERTRIGKLQNIYVKNLLPVIFDLIESLGEELPIDESRIYTVGASMGGSGTWNILQAGPEVFAAGIPVCPGQVLADVSSLTQVSIWTFHGDQDPVAPVTNSRTLFERLSAAGGSIKYTELRGVRHNSWTHAFAYKGDDAERGFVTKSSGKVDPTSDVWEWLFRQRR